MNIANAEKAFNLVTPDKITRYSDYWAKLAPKTEDDVLRRYLFALASVHTTWQGNVRGYEAVKDLGWVGDKTDLLNRLVGAKCGMQNARAKFMWDFAEQFYANPTYYYQKPNDMTWVEYRNQLVTKVNGIGIAKVSFVLEMIHPLDAKVVCGDTHQIQLYELALRVFKSRSEVKTYHEIEQHWVGCSEARNVAPAMARHMMWDTKQGKNDTSYWSFVFHA